jgi:hypothetical protein
MGFLVGIDVIRGANKTGNHVLSSGKIARYPTNTQDKLTIPKLPKSNENVLRFLLAHEIADL